MDQIFVISLVYYESYWEVRSDIEMVGEYYFSEIEP